VKVVRWIEANPGATAEQFESYLTKLYQTSTDLTSRFPGGLK
jgi:hypothetical protein